MASRKRPESLEDPGPNRPEGVYRLRPGRRSYGAEPSESREAPSAVAEADDAAGLFACALSLNTQFLKWSRPGSKKIRFVLLAPQMMRSLIPSPARRTLSPEPPFILSLPRSPFTVSSCLPPLTQSSPIPPKISSLPSWPLRLSPLSLPLTKSPPRLANMSSCLFVPNMSSCLLVPKQSPPPQCIVAARATPPPTTIASAIAVSRITARLTSDLLLSEAGRRYFPPPFKQQEY